MSAGKPKRPCPAVHHCVPCSRVPRVATPQACVECGQVSGTGNQACSRQGARRSLHPPCSGVPGAGGACSWGSRREEGARLPLDSWLFQGRAQEVRPGPAYLPADSPPSCVAACGLKIQTCSDTSIAEKSISPGAPRSSAARASTPWTGARLPRDVGTALGTERGAREPASSLQPGLPSPVIT